MKKKFSLDYSVYYDTERVEAIKQILNNLNETPSNSDLELMANYIIYGKDKNGQNAIQRKESYEEKKRFNSYKKISEKNESLEALTENTLFDQLQFKEFNERKIYKKVKPQITKEDADIPTMRELWDSIERLQRKIDIADGKISPEPHESIIADSYKIYQMRHQLIQLKQDQYLLKDLFKPTIKFLNCQPSPPQLIDWNTDSYYYITKEQLQFKKKSSYIPIHESQYEVEENGRVKWYVRRHNFDWENPKHIRALIDHYSAIWQMSWDQPYSDARILIMDLDRYVTKLELSPLRQYIFERRIDRCTYPALAREIEQKFGVFYNENHLCNIVALEIPKRIAQLATKERLLLEDGERKTCCLCKRQLPKHSIFFGKNRGRRDGFSSACKECEQKRRNGGVISIDKRYKEAILPKM